MFILIAAVSLLERVAAARNQQESEENNKEVAIMKK